MQTIFVVEDDESIREMVLYALTTAGFEAVGFEDGDTMFAMLNQKSPSMILLDIMLPGRDGISILKQVRQLEKFKDIPIIMLTAKSGEMDRIKGLDYGADDYITKPFSVMEVVSRIKAVLRRYVAPTAEAEHKLHIGEIVLDTQKRLVTTGSTEIELTYKEFELLHYLMQNEDIVLSRDKLLEQVWGYDYGGASRTVDMHVKSLRQKLGDAGQTIKTVRNVGYKIGGNL